MYVVAVQRNMKQYTTTRYDTIQHTFGLQNKKTFNARLLLCVQVIIEKMTHHSLVESEEIYKKTHTSTGQHLNNVKRNKNKSEGKNK